MRIHLLGIGGTGLGSLAGLLIEAGHHVTGTDERLYPPMSEELAKLGLKPFEGYSAANIKVASPDMVIIGNVIRRENPEAQEVMRLGIPYMSMPQALAEFFLKGRSPIVITGTHGKTTLATMAAWLLEASGEDPGFLIGGVGLNYGRSYSKGGTGPFFVVEGDEYDTAFFDKGPKFLHYRPETAIITSIEFDHADIYQDIKGIIDSFMRFVALLPPDGLLVANSDDANVVSVAKSARCRVVTYGIGSGEYRPSNIMVSDSGTVFDLAGISAGFKLPMWGVHNLSNATGALVMLAQSGIAPSKLLVGLPQFKGVKRRQELVGNVRGIAVIDDFAHHPTAVARTIEATRLCFPGRRLLAIFEPRSNTSRRNIFQKDFAQALSLSDRVIIGDVYRAEAIPDGERLDPQAMASAIMSAGIDAHHVHGTMNIVEFVMRGLLPNDVILVMSNGAFDGLPMKIVDALGRRKAVGNRAAFKTTPHPPLSPKGRGSG